VLFGGESRLGCRGGKVHIRNGSHPYARFTGDEISKRRAMKETVSRKDPNPRGEMGKNHYLSGSLSLARGGFEQKIRR